MQRFTKRLPAVLLATGALALTVTAVTWAAATTITLNLHGGVSQQRTACHQLNHYTAYKRGAHIAMDGFVTPAPALPDGAWKVKIKVKKCVLGRFKTILQVHRLGNGVLVGTVKEGHYRWTYTPKTTGYYFARAYYYTSTTTSVQSTDEHFHVHS